MHQWRGVILLGFIVAVAVDVAPRAEQIYLIRAGDAYVVEDSESLKWTVGTDTIQLELEVDPLLGLRVAGLVSVETGENWDVAGDVDHALAIDGVAFAAGSRQHPFIRAEAGQYRAGVRLDLVFRARNAGSEFTRSYVCYPGAPVVESWTTVTAAGPPLRISDLSLLRLAVAPGIVRWITGLDTPDEDGGPFTLAWTDLGAGESLELGAASRSTERALPWLMVEGTHGEVFAGLVWSGGWRAVLARSARGMEATLSLPGVVTEVAGVPFETPHAFVGVATGSVAEASRALETFIRLGLRDGRELTPRVTYNTWFAYGTHVDEESMRAEIAAAADLGIERFVLDAGWYGTASDPSDFTPGLGRWRADRERFPSGLAALTDYAHARGLSFGLWVEPERVALDLINRPGLAREPWLATVEGRYDPGTTAPRAAQVCLASPAARAWVTETLVALIDEVRPDYVKWDNNFSIVCTRTGHGHGASDGNLAHVMGLYAVLADLRARYPDLAIENCAGGGARLDFGLLPYTDAGWMDDRSAPSARVRHEYQGLGVVLPPAYLFSFVRDHEEEPIAGSKDLPLYIRSRMPGVLGLTWRSDELSAADRATIREEIQRYKSIRDLISGPSARLLTDQVDVGGGDVWDVIQHVAPDGHAVVYAFAGALAGRVVVRPRDLVPDASYQVQSIDFGVLAEATGADLMIDGVELEPAAVSRAHILVFRLVDRLEIQR